MAGGVAIGLVVASPAFAAPRSFVAPDGRWSTRIDGAGFTLVGPRGIAARGPLPWEPAELVVLSGGEGLVGVDSADGAFSGLLLVDGAGALTALSRAELLPPGGPDAWRLDWWVDETAALVVILPGGDFEPVAVSLVDGLLQAPGADVFVRRVAREDLWLGSRLRALEVAAQEGGSARLEHALRRIVREHAAPLVLRLRAAALLRQQGDAFGRSLVLLTARASAASGMPRLPIPEVLLPVDPADCRQPPAPALDRPYDHRAARSYAIQLLPTFLGTDAAPLLRGLLAGADEADRFAALQAIACLAALEPGTTDGLLTRVRQREHRERQRLAAVLTPPSGSPVPRGRTRDWLLALLPLGLLMVLARR